MSVLRCLRCSRVYQFRNEHRRCPRCRCPDATLVEPDDDERWQIESHEAFLAEFDRVLDLIDRRVAAFVADLRPAERASLSISTEKSDEPATVDRDRGAAGPPLPGHCILPAHQPARKRRVHGRLHRRVRFDRIGNALLVNGYSLVCAARRARRFGRGPITPCQKATAAHRASKGAS